MKPVKIKYWRAIIAAVALLVFLLAPPALAATTTWIGPSGNWSVPGNWDNGVPGFPDPDALLTSNTNKTATLDTTTPLLNSVVVDGTGGATFTLLQTYWPSGNLSATAETIGLAGIGVYNQNAGSNTVGSVAGTPIANTTLDRTLVLGFRPGSSGTYNKNGGTLTAWDLMVGRAGTGVFNQPFGNLTVNNDLILGRLASGTGTVNITSGGLQVGGSETVGFAGVGEMNHTSGTHTIGGALFVGRNAGSTGKFTMTSGSLQVGGNEIIGLNGEGEVTHTSGNHTVGGNFILGRNAGSTGTFTMTSGNLEVAGLSFIGRAGDGFMTMTSGNFTVGGNEVIGRDAVGSLSMTSGNHTIAGRLTLAKNLGSSGTFNITSGSVTSNNSPPFDGTTDIVISGEPPNFAGGLGQFNINGGATITGDVENSGTVKTTGADVTWNGDFVNNNAYISDPSTQDFQNDLTVNDTGYIQATHNADLFRIRGDFINTSTQDTLWDTNAARLRFAKGGVENDTIHDFYVNGVNNGPPGDVTVATIVDNFAWRLLNITNQDINLVDADNDATGALYVGVLLGADVTVGPNRVHNIFGDIAAVLDIFYDPDLAQNAYLGGLFYQYENGPGLGRLRPFHTPLPPSVLLLGTGLLGLGALGWRRKRR